MSDFSNYSAKSKYYDDSNAQILMSDSSEYKKAKGVKKMPLLK